MIENTIFVIIDKKYILTCTQINQQNIHNYEYTKHFRLCKSSMASAARR